MKTLYSKDKCCDNCCCCCCVSQDAKVQNEPCCCCKKEVPRQKRIYADIFNMSGHSVGKYVEYFNQTGCCCCVTKTSFFEVYFPSDANELLKLALIGHLLLLIQFGTDIFATLPGSNDNLALFVE